MILDARVIWLLAIGMVCAVFDWVAVIKVIRPLEYIFKPLTLIVFVATAVLLRTTGPGSYLASWFLAALVFSLAGDIFLMLPGERWFIPGLGAFLLGHLCYIFGFNGTPPPWGAAVPLMLVAIVDALVLRRITGALRHSGETELQIPVIVYGIILSLTLVSGWATWFRPGWTQAGRIAASLGGTLFYASDLMLAWDRFVARSRLLHVLVIVTYHAGQLGLVLTIALR